MRRVLPCERPQCAVQPDGRPERAARPQKDVEESRPDDYLPWGDAADLPKGKKATTIAAGFGGHATNWIFRDGGYVNENSYAAEGDEFPTDTVLVLRVQVGDAGYTDPAGNPVPETKLEGQGAAFLFHDGRVVNATWKKDGPATASTLRPSRAS